MFPPAAWILDLNSFDSGRVKAAGACHFRSLEDLYGNDPLDRCEIGIIELLVRIMLLVVV